MHCVCFLVLWRINLERSVRVISLLWMKYENRILNVQYTTNIKVNYDLVFNIGFTWGAREQTHTFRAIYERWLGRDG